MKNTFSRYLRNILFTFTLCTEQSCISLHTGQGSIIVKLEGHRFKVSQTKEFLSIKKKKKKQKNTTLLQSKPTFYIYSTISPLKCITSFKFWRRGTVIPLCAINTVCSSSDTVKETFVALRCMGHAIRASFAKDNMRSGQQREALAYTKAGFHRVMRLTCVALSLTLAICSPSGSLGHCPCR